MTDRKIGYKEMFNLIRFSLVINFYNSCKFSTKTLICMKYKGKYGEIQKIYFYYFSIVCFKL